MLGLVNVPDAALSHGIPQDGGSAQDMVPETEEKLAIGQKGCHFYRTSFCKYGEDGGLYGVRRYPELPP